MKVNDEAKRFFQQTVLEKYAKRRPELRLKILPPSNERDMNIQRALVNLQNKLTEAINEINSHSQLGKSTFVNQSLRKFQGELIGIIIAYLITLPQDERTQVKINNQRAYRFLNDFINKIGSKNREENISQAIEGDIHESIGEAFLRCIHTEESQADINNKDLKRAIGKVFWSNIEFNNDPFRNPISDGNTNGYLGADIQKAKEDVENINEQPRAVVYAENPSPAETAINGAFTDLQDIEDSYR